MQSKPLICFTNSHRDEVALHLLEPRPQVLHLHHQFLHLFRKSNMLDITSEVCVREILI